MLREEGIYSSHLSAWRAQLAERGADGLAERKAGRKPKLDAKDRQIADLAKRNARLERELHIAKVLIDLQKNHPGLRPTSWTRNSVGAYDGAGPEGAAGSFLALSNP
jgi:hypothetical protein